MIFLKLASNKIALGLLVIFATLPITAQKHDASGMFDVQANSGVNHYGHSDNLAAARAGGADSDGDGQDDYEDNCRFVYNASQLDTDADGFGNACDPDLDNNGFVNFLDVSIFAGLFGTGSGIGDFNGDGNTNFLDFSILPDYFRMPPGPSGMSCAGTAPCPAPRLFFAWPMPGADADDWVINNYVDLDPGAGILDFAGGAKSYDGHRGIDIDVPTFREMDNNFPILAVAQGTVLALDDSHFDRNTSWVGAGPWNFVTVGHPNGFKTIYGHLKQNSVVVNVGDVVQQGAVLGVVGSSGRSTAPHLHLETHDENGVVVEPFANGMWLSPPVYDTLIGFMDATLYGSTISNVDMIKDPPANIDTIEAGQTFGIGLSMGGGSAGDSVNLRIMKGASLVAQNTINWPGVLRHSYWWWNYNFATDAVGAHRLEIRVNGSLTASYPILVTTPGLGGFYQVRHGVPAASYQALFDLLTANGYRLIWIDGYQAGGSTFFNVIFDKSVVTSWAAAHHLTTAGYQTFFDAQVAAGRRLVHVDSYRLGNSLRHAPIFVEQGGTAWVAYHNATLSQHQTNFDNFTGLGYRASVISLAEDSAGTLRVTALYDQNPVGGWVALANMTSAQYQTEFTDQANAGRALNYLNAYSVNGSPRFSAIWNSVVPTSWVAQHDLTSAQFQTAFDNWTGAGLNTRLITGYDNGSGVHYFGGLWTN